MAAKEYLKWLVEDKLALSDGAAEKVGGIGLTEKNVAATQSELDQLRWVCGLAGVTYRMDDESGAVHVELPEESLAAWEPWWKSLRDDRIALMDLGLVEVPDGSRLDGKALEEWVKELSSKDPRHARVARTVLRTVSADQIDAVRKRIADPSLTGLDRRLALRKLGRAYFYREGADEGDYVMNLDGSGVRKVSGDLPLYFSGTPCAAGTVSYVPVLEGEKQGLYVLDLVGNAPPRRLSKLSGAIFCPGDGAHVALRDEAGALWLIDAATGKEQKLAAKDGSYFYWSPDGKMLGWTLSEKEGVHLLDVASGKVREYPDCAPYLEFMVWHPDSTRWACRRRLDYPVPAEGCKTRSRIEVTDVASGKTVAVTDEVLSSGLGWPAWSPDGLTMAAGWLDRSGGKGLAKVLLHDLATGKTRELSHPVSCAPNTGAESRVTWISRGRVVWQDGAVESGWACEIDKGTWARHDKPTYSAQTVAGEWTLDEADGDIVIVHNGDGTRFNLTESAAREGRVRALPPLK